MSDAGAGASPKPPTPRAFARAEFAATPFSAGASETHPSNLRCAEEAPLSAPEKAAKETLVINLKDLYAPPAVRDTDGNVREIDGGQDTIGNLLADALTKHSEISFAGYHDGVLRVVATSLAEAARLVDATLALLEEKVNAVRESFFEQLKEDRRVLVLGKLEQALQQTLEEPAEPPSEPSTEHLTYVRIHQRLLLIK